MATLKKCKTCGNSVSSDAQNCPHCGAKQKKPFWQYSGCGCSSAGCLLIVLLAFLICALFINAKDRLNHAKELAKDPTPVNVQKTEEKQMEFFDITAISFAKTKLEEVLNVKTDIKFPKPGKVKKLKGTFDKTMGIKGELYEVKQLFEVKNDYGVWEKYNYRSIVEFHSARGYRVLLIQVDGVQIFPPLE